ncbi:MAG: guanylate kinase [candidate division WOR-3 bacterium]
MSSKPRHRPFLVVLSAPSGAGKSSICRAVLRRDRGLVYSVSVTTRPKRHNERNRRSYIFVTEQEFQRLVRQGALLEHARVYGHYYGTPKRPVLAAFRRGRDVIADLDIQGMRSCKRLLPGTVAIFVTAPSSQELSRRLLGRGSDSAEELARRRAALKEELAAIPEFDYLIVNDRLADAVEDVLAIIRAERLKTGRCPSLNGWRHPAVKTERKGD